ncbi:hypothetical protein D3C87_1656130 [compost metagenome]
MAAATSKSCSIILGRVAVSILIPVALSKLVPPTSLKTAEIVGRNFHGAVIIRPTSVERPKPSEAMLL